MQIGELYLVKEYCWFLFPTKELAGSGRWHGEARVGGRRITEAQSYTKLLSENYKCKVSFFEPNTYVVLLEESERCYKLLDSNGNIGWISCSDFSRYFEFVKE